jgi:hypothetical protein
MAKLSTPSLLLAAYALCACGSAEVDSVADPESDHASSRVRVSGHAHDFGAGGGVPGGEVRILEMPERVTFTDAEGAFLFEDLPGDAEVTLTLAADGYYPIQTGTFQLAGEDMERFSFQVPSDAIFEMLRSAIDLSPDPEKCQIASTVTRRGNSVYDTIPGTHGEPGATVTISPSAGEVDGPVYFEIIRYNAIFPKRGLTETTDDGGVLFLNVEPGTHVLDAHKTDTTFRSATIKCRPGVLVNASPPWGLQAMEGGLGPRTEPNWGGGE